MQDCYRQTNTTDRYETLHFDLRNTSDPGDTIRLQLNNFSKTQASNVYHLDDPAGRYLTVSGTEQVLRCVEDQQTAPHAVGVTARSPGNHPSCDSTGCTVQITEPDPAQPDRLTLQVDCPELCEDNSYFICKAAGGGRVRFRVTANCPLRP